MKNRQPLEHDNYASSLHNNYTCIGLCSNMSDYVRTFPIVFSNLSDYTYNIIPSLYRYI